MRLARLANTDDGEADQLQTAESGEGLSAEVVSSPRGFAALSSDASSVCVLSVAGEPCTGRTAKETGGKGSLLNNVPH